jgi:5-methylcytosine-specific restriction endonuclease McrA
MRHLNKIGQPCRVCGELLTDENTWIRSDRPTTVSCKRCRAHNMSMGALRRKRTMEGAVVNESISISKLRLILGDDCLYCDRPMSFGNRVGTSATIDHLIAVSAGGTHTYDNVVLACKSCNSRKHTRVLDAWLRLCALDGYDVVWITYVTSELVEMGLSALAPPPASTLA